MAIDSKVIWTHAFAGVTWKVGLRYESPLFSCAYDCGLGPCMTDKPTYDDWKPLADKEVKGRDLTLSLIHI